MEVQLSGNAGQLGITEDLLHKWHNINQVKPLSKSFIKPQLEVTNVTVPRPLKSLNLTKIHSRKSMLRKPEFRARPKKIQIFPWSAWIYLLFLPFPDRTYFKVFSETAFLLWQVWVQVGRHAKSIWCYHFKVSAMHITFLIFHGQQNALRKGSFLILLGQAMVLRKAVLHPGD